MRKMLLKRVRCCRLGVGKPWPRVKSGPLPASINTGLLEHSRTHSSSCTACRRCHIWDVNHSWVTVYDLLTNSITLWPFAEFTASAVTSALQPSSWFHSHETLALPRAFVHSVPVIPTDFLYVWASSDKCKKKRASKTGGGLCGSLSVRVEVDSMVYFTLSSEMVKNLSVI